MTWVNYGINREISIPHCGKKMEHANFKTEVNLEFDNPDFLQAMVKHVLIAHPGWSLTGYAQRYPTLQDELLSAVIRLDAVVRGFDTHGLYQTGPGLEVVDLIRRVCETELGNRYAKT